MEGIIERDREYSTSMSLELGRVSRRNKGVFYIFNQTNEMVKHEYSKRDVQTFGIPSAATAPRNSFLDRSLIFCLSFSSSVCASWSSTGAEIQNK